MRSAASFPARNPPLQRVVRPFEGSEIVAYKPLPILRTEAKPLSTSGVAETRESPASSVASAGRGMSFATAYIAPKHEVFARKLRRENGAEPVAGFAYPARSIIFSPLSLRLTLDDRGRRKVILAERALAGYCRRATRIVKLGSSYTRNRSIWTWILPARASQPSLPSGFLPRFTWSFFISKP